jgi:hypothetical protein
LKDILIFVPVLGLEAETIRSIFALRLHGAVSVLMQRDNPSGNPYADHLHQYQRGREAFLAGPYDGLMIIESDMIVPPDALERLSALHADVAYGCYLYRVGRVVNVLERYAPWPEPAKNPGESLSIRHLWLAAQAKGIIDCSGSGLGCVLIDRRVIEAVPFTDEMTRSGRQFFDYPWTCAVYEAGYHMMADCGVQCGHINQDGSVLWPR